MVYQAIHRGADTTIPYNTIVSFYCSILTLWYTLYYVVPGNTQRGGYYNTLHNPQITMVQYFTMVYTVLYVVPGNTHTIPA